MQRAALAPASRSRRRRRPGARASCVLVQKNVQAVATGADRSRASSSRDGADAATRRHGRSIRAARPRSRSARVTMPPPASSCVDSRGTRKNPSRMPARSLRAARSSGIGGPTSARSGSARAPTPRPPRRRRIHLRQHVHVLENRVQLRDERLRRARRRGRAARARRCGERRRA